MIKFFRRIRKQLLSENKFSKYLFYAIGEIVLVVIGILIALSINNWNEGRKNATNTILMLKQLKEENLSNLSELLEGRTYRDSLVTRTNNFIEFLKNEDSTAQVNRMKYHLAFMLQSESYSFSENALERYINSNVQENSILVKELLELQSYQKDLTYISEKAMDERFENVFDFLIEDIDYNTFEIRSFETLKSFEFRNKLSLTYMVENTVADQFNKTLRKERKVDSILTIFLKNQ